MSLLCALLRTWGVLVALLLASRAAPARADLPVDVAGALRGVELGTKLDLLEDRTGTLRVEQLVHGEQAARFTRSVVPAPSFGFTSSTYWLRLHVANSGSTERPWLLELSYPLLDDVALYEPRADGRFAVRRTGDMVPFSQRDLAYRNFVFALHEPAHGERVYFMRVATTSTMSLPLVAWSTREFLEHQHVEWSALCIFYGVLLVMACYNGCVWGFTKQREYLPYVGYIVSLALLQFTLAGHTYQFLLPNDSWLVQRAMPVLLCSTLLFGTRVVVQTYLPLGHFMYRVRDTIVASCALSMGLSFVLPPSLVIHWVMLGVLTVLLVALATGVELLRIEGRRAKLFLFGWGSMIAGALVASLRSLGVIPHSFVADWSVQIGASVQLVLVSSALADNLNTARADLGLLHGTLQHKVGQLSLALARAEEATQRAERATQLKDEFMATMSHEFRTPLNPIINIPQEMVREFVEVREASCAHCASVFELDEGEHVADQTPCPECANVGGLHERRTLRFLGDANRTRRFLLKVESSGRHLLQVVNGILEFSKLEAGHRELTRESVPVAGLVEEVLAPLRARATERGLALQCELSGADTVLEVDGHRIRLVLNNLLDNAIKYSERAGSVTLRGERSERGYAFSVADQGIGIERKNFEQIFQSFEQVHRGTTRRFGGTGLGLSIARSIVRMHGGELTVDSELGRGATFSFDLPGTVKRPLQREEREARPSRASGGTG